MFIVQKQKFKYFFASILVAGSLVVTGSLFLPANVDAQSIGRPFGGRSQSVRYCSCSAGCWKVSVGRPRGGTFMWCPWSTIYSYYNKFPPAWQLGMATGYVACMQISYPSCRSDGGGMLMKINGTSIR